MTSRKAEDVHLSLLNKLLLDSGLECLKSGKEVIESMSSDGEIEEIGPPELEPKPPAEEAVEEEVLSEIVEQEIEEKPQIFPSPSLRQLLSNNARKIEDYNSIHVLPLKFTLNINPALIPQITITPQQKYIDILGEMTGCTKYKSSLAEFWFLDTLANLVRRAQEDDMDKSSQAVLIYWFCEWMKEMQQFDAADRNRMMRRFKDNILSAGRLLAQEDILPIPMQAGVFYETQQEVDGTGNRIVSDEKYSVTFEGGAFECSLRNLTLITHYIFDLFSGDYQYDLIRSVFTFTPQYRLIDTPYQMRVPKRLFAPLKAKPKEKSMKKDLKAGGKAKKREVITEDFLAFMELQAKDEREHEEQEERDREWWHRRNHILPLGFAATDELFDKYWPPPTPDPEPKLDQEPKGKGRKGKK